MIIKVEAWFDVNEGRLTFGDPHPTKYLLKQITDVVQSDVVNLLFIEATVPTERAILINKK